MLGRGYPDASAYRYGFNGMEKDKEVKGDGNSYDYGARIYDPRLGRWLSLDPLKDKYPNVSPFAYAVNSPIFLIDIDGRLLRDANGNIIYSKNMAPPFVTEYKVGKAVYLITYNPVWIYANDGSKHEALLTTVSTIDGKDVTDQALRLTYDCHGLTQTEGKLFINSKDPNTGYDAIGGLMKQDRGGKIDEYPLEQAKKGDIIIFRDKNGDICHTAIVNDDEQCSYNSKNGWEYEQTETESLTNLKVMYGDKITITHPVEDKKIDKLQKQGENGIAQYKKSEVKKAMKEIKKAEKAKQQTANNP